MEVMKLISRIHDNVTVRRVFGEPITVDGVTVIPVARIAAGGGGGGGGGPSALPGDPVTDREQAGDRHAEGAGAGFGLAATPAGVYVIKEGKVRWEPALDVNRLVVGGQIVAVVALLTLRAIVRGRARARAGAQGVTRRGR
ncbi:hypothetical protein Psi02_13120 [Planotetraspora silvatica]|uniref:Sporulation protein n=1 Tax=Planotetraspora silvatica TaxID=234614 RepID=A0A8J3UGJ5_9ACTN|nr:spore germination protein GerW family protein [Planotetraspora silvatica]GII44888.1 hypothetical protein Psi02_13120 [Planotetraspora silvatica]